MYIFTKYYKSADKSKFSVKVTSQYIVLAINSKINPLISNKSKR